MEEIKNEKESIRKGKCLCDEDIIKELLMCEKNISNNYSIALNEMSNKYLYKVILSILTETKNMAREIYNYAFSKGYYTLKTESESEIDKLIKEYNSKLTELS